MIAYVLSSVDLSTKDILQFDEYEFNWDIDFADKSTIEVIKQPNIENDDFVICKDGSKTVFTGICDSFSSENSGGYKITLLQIEKLFDRMIFAGTQSVISSTGLEDFVRAEILANWVNSGDTLMDKDYITVTASTHTTKSITVDTKDGIYNLKTFLGNIKEKYGIFLDFELTNDSLDITVRHDTAAAVPIDVTISDISDYSEIYNVDVLSKLSVKWKNRNTEVVSSATYYLRNDRTITTNMSDVNRAQGVAKAVFYEVEDANEMYQSVVDEFSGNNYEHKISFKLFKGSMAYPVANYYVGRNATIKTKTGIKTSIITGMSSENGSAFFSFTFGKLKVSLIEKIRSANQ